MFEDIRVTIAKEVLSLLDEKHIVPKKSTFVRRVSESLGVAMSVLSTWEGESFAPEADLKDYVLGDKCLVCAVGAAVVAAIKVDPSNEAFVPGNPFKILSKYFTDSLQLFFMEAAFEGGPIITSEHLYNPSDDEYVEAQAYVKQFNEGLYNYPKMRDYGDDGYLTIRMRAIFQWVIDNNGNFPLPTWYVPAEFGDEELHEQN